MGNATQALETIKGELEGMRVEKVALVNDVARLVAEVDTVTSKLMSAQEAVERQAAGWATEHTEVVHLEECRAQLDAELAESNALLDKSRAGAELLWAAFGMDTIPKEVSCDTVPTSCVAIATDPRGTTIYGDGVQVQPDPRLEPAIKMLRTIADNPANFDVGVLNNFLEGING